ncbi:MAG: hypothetical protein Alpg2KO_12300 [Alphaproteobacteria bacterium]
MQSALILPDSLTIEQLIAILAMVGMGMIVWGWHAAGYVLLERRISGRFQPGVFLALLPTAGMIAPFILDADWKWLILPGSMLMVFIYWVLALRSPETGTPWYASVLPAAFLCAPVLGPFAGLVLLPLIEHWANVGHGRTARLLRKLDKGNIPIRFHQDTTGDLIVALTLLGCALIVASLIPQAEWSQAGTLLWAGFASPLILAVLCLTLLRGTYYFELRREGVKISSPFRSLTVPWKQVDNVEVSDDNGYLIFQISTELGVSLKPLKVPIDGLGDAAPQLATFTRMISRFYRDWSESDHASGSAMESMFQNK